jgi:ribose transport system substrate-binding protein
VHGEQSEEEVLLFRDEADAAARRRPTTARLRAMVLVAVAMLVVAVVAGCGSSGSDSGGGASTTAPASDGSSTAGGATDDVTALLTKAAADTEKFKHAEASFEPWNPGPAPKATPGIKTAAMSCLQIVPTCKQGADAMGEAMKAIGWDGQVVDGTPDAAKQRAGVESFLTKGVKGFILMAIDPHGMADVLKRADAKKVKWGGMAGIDPRPFGGMGPNVDIKGGFYQGGQELGAWVANDSKGKAKVLIFNASDNPALAEREKGFRDYLSKFPDVEFVDKTITVPFANVGAPLQAQAKSVFQKYPAGKVEYVFGPFDGFSSFLVNAAQSLGRKDLKILGFDGAPQNVDFIRSGSQAATLATAWGWCSWALVDDLNRALNGEPVKGGTCPGQIVDKTNVPPEGQGFDGNADYKSEFKKLWGVG